jgi:hypothetical protein
LLKIASLTTGLLAAGLFLTPLPASAAQIGVGAIPEATTTVETVQYGYGGYGRPHYGRRFYGGRGLGYGRHFHGGPRFGRGYGYGRGYGRGYGYGRRGF